RTTPTENTRDEEAVSLPFGASRTAAPITRRSTILPALQGEVRYLRRYRCPIYKACPSAQRQLLRRRPDAADDGASLSHPTEMPPLPSLPRRRADAGRRTDGHLNRRAGRWPAGRPRPSC